MALSYWESFVAHQREPPEPSPFMDGLRGRLARGATLMGVEFHGRGSQMEGYHVVQDCYLVRLLIQKRVEKLIIPHSADFTQWSLTNNVRMDIGEVGRITRLLHDRLDGMSSCREVVAGLQPPESLAYLEVKTGRKLNHNPNRLCRHADEAFVAKVAVDLLNLRYTVEEAAGILDRALVGYLRDLEG